MAENSKIEWTHHTFNPWVGCTKVSPACDHCYAESWSIRAGRRVWGARADRERTRTWINPLRWDKTLEGTGRRERVFCASLADVFDNHKSIQQEWRDTLWHLIRETPNLDWLLLTKRPQNIIRFIPDDWQDGYPNVWLGTTVENQAEANRRVRHLINVPARVRFLSCEPLLGAVDLTGLKSGYDNHTFLDALRGKYWVPSEFFDWSGKPPRISKRRLATEFCPSIDWIITGGESGLGCRASDPDWFRSLRDQCNGAGVSFFFKQWGGSSRKKIKALGRELDGVIHDEYPNINLHKENDR